MEILTDSEDWQLQKLENGFRAEVGVPALTEEMYSKLTAAIQNGETTFFLAKRGYRAVGMCSITRYFSSSICSEAGILSDLYVEPVFRKKGIAQMPNVKYTDSATFRCLENLKEGSLDISLIHTGKEHCPPGHICSMPRDEFIIHFVLDGTGFYSAGGQTWSLTPGQMFVIYPNEPVTYGADETNPWTYAWIGFRGIRAHSMVKECGFSKNQLVLPAPDQKIILKHIDYMLNHKQLSKANDLRRQAYLILLLAELAGFHEKQSAQNKKNTKYAYSTSVYVELAIEYIKDMYQKGIGISDIADNIGISRAYLNSSFQKELGMSAQTFLIDYKMHKAASLLVSTSLSVKEIANNVGYEDQLVFSKAFKKKFGMSPKNYKTHKEMMDKFNEKQVDHPV